MFDVCDGFPGVIVVRITQPFNQVFGFAVDLLFVDDGVNEVFILVS